MRLTVLQVIPALEVGGAERTTVDIAAAVVAAGGRAIVVSEGGRLVPELTEAGGEHVAMPVARRNPFGLVANAARLARLIRREGVDIVHARSRAPAWSALWAARRTGTPFVTTYHGAYGQRGRLKAFYNSVMARGDVVIANSAYTANLVAARHPFADGRIVTIPRGTDFAAFEAPGLSGRAQALRREWRVPESDLLILQLARLTRWKGQAVLIEALARLGPGRPRPWTAVLAGDDQGRHRYRGELDNLAAARGLATRVRLPGPCTEVAAAMTAADIVVVASTEPEAFGRAAVEAQAAGRPVIVSDLGAVPETVRAPPAEADEERTGWRVPAGDPRALAGTLESVMAMPPAARASVGARGRRHVRANFSVGAMQTATLDVYGLLLKH